MGGGARSFQSPAASSRKHKYQCVYTLYSASKLPLYRYIMPPKQSKRKEPVQPSRAEDPDKKAAKKARKEAQVKEAMAHLLSDGKQGLVFLLGRSYDQESREAHPQVLPYPHEARRDGPGGQERRTWLILHFQIHAWEKNHLENLLALAGIPLRCHVV